jgi:hypothetical protein
MEEWYSIVRELKDASEVPYKTNELCSEIFILLKRSRIKEKVKFKQRMGPEFEKFVADLVIEYPHAMVNAVIFDDEFWETTIKLTLRV